MEIEQLPQSGSSRKYYRITAEDAKKSRRSYIAVHNINIAENKTFIHFSRHFKKENAPAPEIIAVNEDGTIYLQQDFGNETLLNKLEQYGHTNYVFDLYKKSLKELAHLQINGGKELDYDHCITSKEFGKQAILGDLLYFKYYFLDTLNIPYDKEKFIGELDQLSNYLAKANHLYFMFRDFQARNIMVKNDEVFFIDYQGGMKGALQYDVASLLWQAKANLSEDWKNELLSYYIECVQSVLKKPIDKKEFESQYNGYVLIRLLQVLGAYGFRGLFERKAHFLTSIPLALQNLKWFLKNKKVGINVPEVERLLSLIVQDETREKFETIKANEKTGLVVKINSFSFIKTGYPKDVSTHGGGFVFDCRGILNPGRIEQYKKLTGRDKSVKEYLEQQTRMEEFLMSCFNVVDIAVEDYIKRDFENLTVNFGCTGGQHRSVYAADALARHLGNKYGVKTEIIHIEQEALNVILTEEPLRL